MKLTSLHRPSTQPLETSSGCIEAAMNIIGNKWTALILRDLAAGECRFCNLEKTVGKINPRTLSKRLDELEAEGIITRVTYNEVPPRVEYSLTQKGRDLLPILKQMALWGEQYAQ